MTWQHMKAVILLPFTVTVVIPAIILSANPTKIIGNCDSSILVHRRLAMLAVLAPDLTVVRYRIGGWLCHRRLLFGFHRGPPNRHSRTLDVE